MATEPTETPGRRREGEASPPAGDPFLAATQVEPVAGDDPLVGITLGGCTIRGKLGAGGMGVVYRATHLALEKPVVVKILPPGCTNDPQLRQRFILEARATARLTHKNIVQIYDAGFERGYLFYVMEYVEGTSLEDLCRREGPLDPARATAIIREAAAGLERAHAKGIIHRDMKPANILISGDGDVKVSDFGLARDLGGEKVSATGEVVGTPHYMAPEQADGKADARSDLYSLGVTLYKALTNRVPFEGSSSWQVMKAHIEKPPPDPRSFRPELPEALVLVLERLLRKNPAERYPGATDLVSDLRAIGDALGRGATPAIPPFSSRFGRRSVPKSLLLTLSVLVVAVPAAIYGPAWIGDRWASPGPGSGGSAGGSVGPVTPEVHPLPTPEIAAAAAGIFADPAAGSGPLLLGRVEIAGTVEGEATPGRALLVEGEPVPLDEEGRFRCVREGVPPGHTRFTIRLVDDEGRTVAERPLEVEVAAPPRIIVDEAAGGSPYTYLDHLRLAGRIEGEFAARYTLAASAGVLDRPDAARFVLALDALPMGEAPVALTLTVDGETAAEETVRVARLVVPDLVVASPAAGAWVRSPAVVISGRVVGDVRPGLSVVCGADRADPAPDGRFDLATAIAGEGVREVPLEVVFQGEVIARRPITMGVDARPPQLTLREPASGVVAEESLDAGRVRVVLAATDASPVEATCGGARLDRTPDGVHSGVVPVARGWNALPLEAVDAAGNRATLPLRILVVPAGMIHVPAGAFVGGPPGEGRSIDLGAFFIDRTEVRCRDYQRFLDETHRPAPRTWEATRQQAGWEDLPVTSVTFVDAQAFAAWRGGRLPTQDEWERAAGWDGHAMLRYPWGNDLPADFAGFANVSGRQGRLVSVLANREHPSPIGCLNMAGNAAEWVDAPPNERGERAVMGGSYRSEMPERNLVTWQAGFQAPGLPLVQTGFRCAMSVAER